MLEKINMENKNRARWGRKRDRRVQIAPDGAVRETKEYKSRQIGQ